MSTEDYHHENDHEDELPNGNTTNTRQPFTRSEDLYDNLGDGGDFTRRRRVNTCNKSQMVNIDDECAAGISEPQMQNSERFISDGIFFSPK